MGIKYVRLDHVFTRPREELRRELAMIKAIGATPVISLSYFPKNVSKADTAYPYDWGQWSTTVTGLVNEISRQFDGVYYEVWNEPDGKTFGGWSPNSYLELYRRTVAAVQTVQNVKTFKIGGPSLADPNNRRWVETFLNGVDDQNLRMDFVSWHRYHRDPKVFLKDLEMMESLLATHPDYVMAEKIITEWGTDPGVSANHYGIYDAAHFAAVARQLIGRVDLATKFEIRDGIWTNDLLFGVKEIKAGEGLGVYTYDGQPKPLAAVMGLLGQVRGTKINLMGEGSNVTGFAAQDRQATRILLVNFEKSRVDVENVPVTILGLAPGTYTLNKNIVDKYNPYNREEKVTLVLPDGRLSFNQLMLPDSVVLLSIYTQ